MVLDTGTSIFIWVGVNSNKNELAMVEKGVFGYLKSDPKGRDLDTPIMKIRQGCEPGTFTGFFGVWYPQSWTVNKREQFYKGELNIMYTVFYFKNRMDFDKLKEQMMADNPNMTIALANPMANGTDRNRYPLAVLQEKDPEKLPADVDPIQKELFLHDSEFARVFKMERQAYESLPEWKRHSLKKSAGIF